MGTSIAVIVIIIFCLLILSAFFSGSETAMTAASRARIHELSRKGNKRAKNVELLIESKEHLLSSLLLGNNLVNIMASALATSVLSKVFGDLGVAYATVIMTILVLVFSEVLPKTYAIIAPEKFALFVAPTLRIFVIIFTPFVKVVNLFISALLCLLGYKGNREHVLSSRDELRGAIELHHKEGGVIKNDRDMLGGILDLGELEVHDVMVHRTKMYMVDVDRLASDIVKETLDSGYTRAPVWKDDPDNIIGIIHTKDMLRNLAEGDGDSSQLEIEPLCTPPWFIPDSTRLTDQLNAFLKRKNHFAIVVDEYGEVMGLITLEDIIEEIVGEITDEHDTLPTGIRRKSDKVVYVEGTIPVRDLNRVMDWHLPEDEATTIAGLVIHETQMIPNVGQAFTFYGFRFEVLRKKRNQITSIRVSKIR